MSVRDLFYSKNRDLSKSDHVCGSESWHEQMRSLRTSEKELQEESHCFPKRNAARLQFAKDNVDKPEGYWRNVLWTDETKIELFVLNEKRYVWKKEKKTLHSSIRNLSHL